jgi:hypothetical protein
LIVKSGIFEVNLSLLIPPAQNLTWAWHSAVQLRDFIGAQTEGAGCDVDRGDAASMAWQGKGRGVLFDDLISAGEIDGRTVRPKAVLRLYQLNGEHVGAGYVAG